MRTGALHVHVLRAHLFSLIKCQADHIDAPPSPRQVINISQKKTTLQRTANGVREAGGIAALIGWREPSVTSLKPCSHLPLLDVNHTAKNIRVKESDVEMYKGVLIHLQERSYKFVRTKKITIL